MSKGWDEAAYLAELRSLDTDAFCRRLLGGYGVVNYKPTPIEAEAARRIAEMQLRIDILEGRGP